LQIRPTLVPLFLLCAAFPPVIRAAPTQGQVVGGDQSAKVSVEGSTTRVTQLVDRAVINWQTFNVSRNETVAFTQPSANSLLLNRVTGAKSIIDGNITANGRIFIVNTRGIVFGPTAQVNVGSLVAMTADTTPDSFLQGNPAFRGTSPATSTIVNQGTITAAAGGNVLLLAPGVVNQGTIRANGGKIVLATGRAFLVDLFGDGLVQVATAAVAGPPSANVTQIGTLGVGSGTVLVRRAFGPASLVGTLNSIPIADYADQAVSLPGGAVAFIGASATQPSAQIDPNWIKPASGSGGGGIIDASPIYGFPAASVSASASAAAIAPAFVPPLEGQNARLAEFNRLGDTLQPAGSYGTQTEFVSNELYIVSAPGSVPTAQTVGFTQSASAATAAAPRAESPKRRCTVAELLRQGCR
jgi:filamentous hemagglutinin family protein